MARGAFHVPYGYNNQQKSGPKGSLFVYDSMEGWERGDFERVIAWAAEKQYAKLVWFPLHEETVRRMGTGPVRPFYRRAEELEEMIGELESGEVYQTVEDWEGRRKKYTPMETAFRFLTEKYPGPHAVYMTERTANLFAGYASFDEWIRKIRLVIVPSSAPVFHPKLLSNENRWERLVL
ncbi:hypothetical protein [Paenibacillus hamazuiensis]|uniref:hypothetical protein n=1 Tax=Paenibacillus hamazuiensis TaxID=2936508 RepID=UPI00200C0212|nr:hypothetical protein [Paenibacillus hamazuiensis]